MPRCLIVDGRPKTDQGVQQGLAVFITRLSSSQTDDKTASTANEAARGGGHPAEGHAREQDEQPQK